MITYNQPNPHEEDLDLLLPLLEDVPDEFKDFVNRSKWNNIYAIWYLKGIPAGTIFVPKEGINEEAAREHIRKVFTSFIPTTAEREAGVSYLLSLWFEDIHLPDEAVHVV